MLNEPPGSDDAVVSTPNDKNDGCSNTKDNNDCGEQVDNSVSIRAPLVSIDDVNL